ncbi:MAG: DUF1092 family protein [Acaryochloridaceae cyanobacterium SU_2_1]|nr:DUF1092 family protein [Acaryochloridaceae cyanobacterium SU_2_1]
MSKVWEIDFYSRPIVDEQQKKLWELLICDSERDFEFSKFCPGSQANARWLQTTLEEALPVWRQAQGLGEMVVPERIRFFRRAMKSIIPRACEAMGIPPQPSRRTFAIHQWLQERYQDVYPNHPGYQPLLAPPTPFEPTLPKPLPDALRGKGWRLVTLEWRALKEMQDWDITFGEGLPLDLIPLAPDAIVPGLLIFSERAIPLAGWMSGLELSALTLELQPQPQLLLETGLNDRWVVANLNKPDILAEIEDFQAKKQISKQVHFLAVQSNPDAQKFAGFWLMQDILPD